MVIRCFRCAALAGVLVWGGGEAWAQLAGAETVDAGTTMQQFVVTADRAVDEQVAGVTDIQTYSANEVEDSGAFNLTEFIERLPEGTRGEETLVLIDGVPTMIDLDSLMPGMIEAIEVNYEGSMPQYGARAQGRVINLRLKKDYRGFEVGGRTGMSFHGDGLEFDTNFNGGVTKGATRLTYSLRYAERSEVTASARTFSREQDHRARGGRDLRVPWGFPATVRAVDGNLDVLDDGAGSSVPVGIVTADGLVAGEGTRAEGQQYFNSSGYRYLAAPSRQLSGNLMLNQEFSSNLSGRLMFSFSARESERLAPPPVSAASAATRVPAALSPYGEEVEVGLVHLGFGPVRGESTALSFQTSGLLQGKVGEWRWVTSVQARGGSNRQEERDLSEETLADAWRTGAINPFAAELRANDEFYRRAAIRRTRDSDTLGVSGSLRAHGPLMSDWRAGPWRLSMNTRSDWRTETRRSRNQRSGVGADLDKSSSSSQISATLNVPLRGENEGAGGLETQWEAGYDFSDDGSNRREGGVGFVWSPRADLRLRAEWESDRRTPSDVVAEIPEVRTATLTDPRRSPSVADNVQVFSRPEARSGEGESNGLTLGATYQPRWLAGWRVRFSYDENESRNERDMRLRAQDVLANEALFPERVLRLEPTETDLALGQPGAVEAVDVTPIAVAQQERRSVDLRIEGRIPRSRFGNVTVSASARRNLAARYEVIAGQAFVSDRIGPANRPEWTGTLRLSWQREAWSVASDVQYRGAVPAANIPSDVDLDVSVGYRFRRPIAGTFGRGLQVRAGARNLLNAEPSFADTILGYRDGSPLGQSFFVSARLPL